MKKPYVLNLVLGRIAIVFVFGALGCSNPPSKCDVCFWADYVQENGVCVSPAEADKRMRNLIPGDPGPGLPCSEDVYGEPCLDDDAWNGDRYCCYEEKD